MPIIGIAQNPSEINHVFLNNIAASITFRLGANEALQMKDLGDYRYRVMRLAEREVVLQLKHRYLEPVVGSTFDIPSEMLENITDAELAVLMKDEWSRLEQLRTCVLEQSVATSTSSTNNGDSDNSFDTMLTAMRDVFPDITATNVQVGYVASGIDDAGNTDVVTALVTVSLTGVTHTFVALGIIPGVPSSMTFPAFSTSALRATQVITPP